MARVLKNKGAAGFTLLELLLALVLLSLLTLTAYSSFNLSLIGVRKGQEDAALSQELRVGMSIVERSLSSAVLGLQAKEQKRAAAGLVAPDLPSAQGPAAAAPETQVLFVGNPQEIKFLTPIPLEAHNLGGLYHWRVMSGTDRTGAPCLVVEQAKIVNWLRDPEGVEVRLIVIKNLTSLKFTYGRDEEEFFTWDGVRQGRLPEWVRVKLSLAGKGDKEWIIPLHVNKDQTKR